MATPDFYFQVLGANSALPTPDRFPSSFILGYKSHLHLIDCGEGSQIKMAEYRVKRSKLDHIFISHLHGDHVFGLPGLLNSFTLAGRTKPMHLYGPVALEPYLQAITEATGGSHGYELVFHLLSGDDVIDLGLISGLHVWAMPLQHRIPTYGYLFKEVQSELNIDPVAIKKYNLTVPEILSAKAGNDIDRGASKLAVKEVTLAPKKLRAFAYCSDTSYMTELVKYISKVDLIYHEATYLHELAQKAKDRMHSTAREAALIASSAKVGQLIIGHYSSRYKNLDPLVKRGTSNVHSNTRNGHRRNCISHNYG